MKKSGKSKSEEEEVLEICRYIKKISEAKKMYTIFIHDSLKMFKRFPILLSNSSFFSLQMVNLSLRRSTW